MLLLRGVTSMWRVDWPPWNGPYPDQEADILEVWFCVETCYSQESPDRARSGLCAAANRDPRPTTSDALPMRPQRRMCHRDARRTPKGALPPSAPASLVPLSSCGDVERRLAVGAEAQGLGAAEQPGLLQQRLAHEEVRRVEYARLAPDPRQHLRPARKVK